MNSILIVVNYFMQLLKSCPKNCRPNSNSFCCEPIQEVDSQPVIPIKKSLPSSHRVENRCHSILSSCEVKELGSVFTQTLNLACQVWAACTTALRFVGLVHLLGGLFTDLRSLWLLYCEITLRVLYLFIVWSTITSFIWDLNQWREFSIGFSVWLDNTLS